MYPKNNKFYLTLLLWLTLAVLPAQQRTLRLPAPDLELLALQDEDFNNPRFSAPISLDIAPAPIAIGAPENFTNTEGNIYQWSQTFTVPKAHGLGLFLDELDLPEGATISLSNRLQTKILTQADASSKNRLFTGFLSGNEVTLTYQGPLPESIPFHVWRIDHVYRPDLWADDSTKEFGESNSCQVNANCAAGDGWENEKSGAARINIIVAEGVGTCSGNLINNTAQDGRPYLLTGFHCMDGFTPLYDLWSADFEYTSADCDNPATEPEPVSYLGMEFRAGLQATDFMLLEIVDVDFATEDHYFAGWDRAEGRVDGTIRHFHHPRGDIQKIGVSGSGGMDILTTRINWNSGVVTPPSHHFRMDYEVGSFQVGSSGSAFFDDARRIRGHLNGGNSSCVSETEAFVGRFNLSWDTGLGDTAQLAPWLDPLGTDPMTMDGASLVSKRFVSGQVVNGLSGQPVSNATITYAWPGGSETYTTDADGRYRGERPATEPAFAISGTFREEGPLDEAVDVGDLITIRRSLLGLSDLSIEGSVAADANNSGTIRVSDITLITRVILGVSDWDGRPNWLVIPVGFPLDPIPRDLGSAVGIALENAGVYELPVDFYVLKTGDANLSGGE